MAILYSYLPFLDACRRAEALQSPLWALGSLELLDRGALTVEAVRSPIPVPRNRVFVTGRNSIPDGSPYPGTDVASLMRDRYGIAEYVDFDLNGQAEVELDVAAPLPERWRAGAGTVLDAGTLEHIFDFPRALENVHSMLRAGGTFIGLVPISFWGHGYVNFDPKLFRELAAANAYDFVVEGYWFRLRLPLLGKRFITVLTREVDERRWAKLWVDRVMNRIQPAQALYLCCYRKTADAPFSRPSDVFANWASPA